MEVRRGIMTRWKEEGEDKGAKNNLTVEILVTSHGPWLRTRENTKSVGIM